MSGWQSQEWIDAWRNASARRNRYLATTTERMFALAGVRDGARVLDLGTGTADTALMIADRVGAHGHVVATDAALAMVTAAGDAVRAAGKTNVTVRAMDACAIDLEPDSFDAAVGRMVIMFVADLHAALTGVLRVLRKRARFATTTWADPDRNPFHGILLDVVRSRDRMPATVPDLVRALSMGDDAKLRDAFDRAGFVDVTIERVRGERVSESVHEALSGLDEGPTREMFSAMSDAERAEAKRGVARAYTAFARADGSVAFPMETLVVAGARP